MGEHISLPEIAAAIAPSLISVRTWSDATFISLPMVYPSGSFVTVRLTHGPAGVRVSDSGFAYRETESFGASRSFAGTARSVAEAYDVEADRRTIYVDVGVESVERAILDVSAASKAVADRVVLSASQETEVDISDALLEKLDRIFPRAVQRDGKVVGASSTEWDVTAVAKSNDHVSVFQVVANYPVSVFKASTAFHDLAALDKPPTLISVVASKAEMGKNYSILAQAGRVVEIMQPDEVFARAAA